MTPLIEKRCPVEQGSEAYQELKDTGAYTVLLEYPSRALITDARCDERSVAIAAQARIRANSKIGCIGAGTFARDTIFPALRKTRGVAMHSVATASGVASESARRLFDFARAVPAGRIASGQRYRRGFRTFPARQPCAICRLPLFPITSRFLWKSRWP